MSWYYASPDGQPHGPYSPEELTAKRASGEIHAETYVLETGAPSPAWRRYQEVFPALALSPVATGESATAPAPGTPPPLTVHRPLLVKTNNWAVIGAIVGVMSLVFMPFCCIGSFLALPGILFSGVGYYEIQRNEPYETGKGVALFGLITSGISLLFLIVLVIWTVHSQKDWNYSIQRHFQVTPNSIH